MRSRLRTAALLTLVALLSSCKLGRDQIDLPPLSLTNVDAGPARFSCRSQTNVACESNAYLTCVARGEFLQVERRDCSAEDRVCSVDRGCVVCDAGLMRCQQCEVGDSSCDRNLVQRCSDAGDAWLPVESCDFPGGFVCDAGKCKNVCDLADAQRSYVGCYFYAADLDNAAIDNLNDASRQQFAVAVANPQPVPVEVKVQIDDNGFGAEVRERVIGQVTVPPGALEVFKLPRRELDGASDSGLDDGSHTALSANAFFVSASHPIVAYQFNPLENVNVFSNGASLMLPTSALGLKYTINGWPQTIANSDNPDQDFDPTSRREDLRAFLTVVGTAADTDVTITLGDNVVHVVGAGPIRDSGPGASLPPIKLGRYDVINLETAGFNADFTGTVVEANRPVTVFVGSEASDVPEFGTYATRQCCADHLEAQLIPDSTLGNNYTIARTPNRTKALAAAAFPGDPLGVSVVNYPEWVRVLAVAAGTTSITTTLPAPNDTFRLRQGEFATLQADQDLVLSSDKPVSVLQALPSQGVTGIPRWYPGGDPDIFPVPPVEQYRKDYIFLTPDKYAFDFVTIMANAGTSILLDGAPLPDSCERSTDGLQLKSGDKSAERVIYRCQLSFPKVPSGIDSIPLSGDQHDGVHTILADREVGIIVNGFDRFVSYAYVGGLNLQVIN